MRNRFAIVIAALVITATACVSETHPQPQGSAEATAAAARNDGSTCQNERVTGSQIDRWICHDNRTTHDDHDQMTRDLQSHNMPLFRQ